MYSSQKLYPNVYLSGQWNEHDDNWKYKFNSLTQFHFYDPETDSNQASPDTYFLDDLAGIKHATFMVANPGLAPSEGTWIEIGYFYATHTSEPGEFCDNLIVIWRNDRLPKWSYDFVAKTGHVVYDVEAAKDKLLALYKSGTSPESD